MLKLFIEKGYYAYSERRKLALEQRHLGGINLGEGEVLFVGSGHSAVVVGHNGGLDLIKECLHAGLFVKVVTFQSILCHPLITVLLHEDQGSLADVTGCNGSFELVNSIAITCCTHFLGDALSVFFELIAIRWLVVASAHLEGSLDQGHAVSHFLEFSTGLCSFAVGVVVLFGSSLEAGLEFSCLEGAPHVFNFLLIVVQDGADELVDVCLVLLSDDLPEAEGGSCGELADFPLVEGGLEVSEADGGGGADECGGNECLEHLCSCVGKVCFFCYSPC